MSVKDQLKGFISRLGYTVTNLDSLIEIDCAWGPNILIYALEDLARRSPERLKIVQIGANDGSDQDPLQPFLNAHACDAILIEPMDHPYASLSDRYRGVSHIRTLQAAISDAPGVMQMHYVVNGSGEPDLTLYSSFDLETVQRNLASSQARDPALKDHSIRSRTLEARTLGSVLDEFGFQGVDAVVVDVEGFDHRIVTSFLNDGIEPRIIRFEYCNLTRREFNALRDLLLKKNYEIVRTGIDIYCQKAGLLR